MDIKKLKSQLPRFDLSRSSEPSDLDREYFDYYDINFSEQLEDLTHYFGKISVPLSADYNADGDVSVVAHYFKKEKAAGTCFVVHGFTDHVGIFAQLINYLLHRGLSVVAFDLPGHGLSDGKPLHVNDFADYGVVLDTVRAMLAPEVAKPMHLMGQSMGGAIIMDYLLTNQFHEDKTSFSKVMLLAPLVRPAGWRSIRLASLLLSPVLRSVKRKFTQSSNDAQFLEFQKNADPLQARRIPTSWVHAMIKWVQQFRQLNWSDQQLLIIQGKKDETIDFRHGASVLRDKFPKAKTIMINGAKHHLACEDEQHFQRVMNAADLYFERRRASRD